MSSAESWQEMQHVGRPALRLFLRPPCQFFSLPFLYCGLNLVSWWARHNLVPWLNTPHLPPTSPASRSERRPFPSLLGSPESHLCHSFPVVHLPPHCALVTSHLSSVLFSILLAFHAHRFWAWWLCPFSHCRHSYWIHLGTQASFRVPEDTRL